MKSRFFGLWLVILCVCSSVLWAGDRPDPRYEQRRYRDLILPNGLKVLLVSDPAIQQAAASLTVGVGSLSDPPKRNGMAHFLEHMLFLGTEKYPDVGEYQAFVGNHNGYTNAYTAEDHTNYHFQVAANFLEPTLDRFAQFFVAPRFDPKYVEREVHIIDSEHSKNIPNDYWRLSAVADLMYEPGHPAHKFQTGNLQTLGSTSRQEMLDFYHKYYSSNRMNLVILGKEDLDTLETWARQKFEPVPNRQTPLLSFPPTFLKKSQKLRLVEIEPLQQMRRLNVLFPLPPHQHHYQTEPDFYLSYLIGYEGQGSLLSLLKRENLATSLSAGTGVSNSSYASLHISIELTPQGQKEYHKVITYLFQYIRLLRQKSLPDYIFQEVKRMTEIGYQFQEKQEGAEYVMHLSPQMNYLPLDRIERAGFLMDRYDPHRFDSLLYHLMPENMLVLLQATGVKTNQVEKYYGVKYAVTVGQADFISALGRVQPHPEMHLPAPNPYIPQDLSLLAQQATFQFDRASLAGLQQEKLPESLLKKLKDHTQERWSSWDHLLQTFAHEKAEIEPFKRLLLKHALVQPEILQDDAQAQLWMQQDLRFGVPKTILQLLFQTPEAFRSARHAVLAQLYAAAIAESLNEVSYPARMSGLVLHVMPHEKGILLFSGGYSEHVFEFLQAMAPSLQKIALNPARFTTIKENLRQDYENFQFELPFKQALAWRSVLLGESRYSREERQKELASITLKELQQYTTRLFQQSYVQGVAYGNLEKNNATQQLQAFLKAMHTSPLPESERPQVKTLALQPHTNAAFEQTLTVENSACLVHVGIDELTPALRVGAMIVSRALKPRFYTELRTNQKLGYIVDAGVSIMKKQLSWIFLVQSGEHPAGLLQQRMESFIPGFIESFKNLSAEEFETLRQGVISARLDRPEVVDEEAKRFFEIAFEREAKFDLVSDDLAVLEKITKAEVVALLEKYLLPENQRRLVIRLQGKKHPLVNASGEVIRSVPQFHQQQSQP